MAIHSADQIMKGLRFETGGTLDASNAREILPIQTKTEDYAVKEEDSGTLFTTYGDGEAIVYTLPANPKKGLFYYFFQSVDEDITINSDSANGIITYLNAAADGVKAVTGTQLIGAMFLIFADGYIWNAACISNGTTLGVTT